MKQYNRILALLAATTIGIGCNPLPALAGNPINQISAVTVDDSGNLVIQVEGEGFDPLVRLEPSVINGQYRILITGNDVTVSPSLKQNGTGLTRVVADKIPAVETAILNQSGKNQSFQLVLTAWQKLQPQVYSNNGQQIVIALVGDHSLPAAVIARRQQAELAKRQAEQKQQQALAEQRRQKELQAAQATRKKSYLAELQRQLSQPFKTAAPGAPASHTTVTSPSSSHSQIAVNANNLDLSEQQLSQANDAVPEALAQLQMAQTLGHRYNPQSLAQTQAQPDHPGQDMPFSPADETGTPMHLKATPANYKPDQSFGEALQNNPSDFEQVFSSINTLSIYALANRSQMSPAFLQAWQAIRDGNIAGAEMTLRNMMDKYPNDPAAQYLLAQVLLLPVRENPDSSPAVRADNITRRETARQLLLKTIVHTPYLPAYSALLGLYLDDGNYKDAQRLWTKASAEYPDDPAILYQQGRLNEGLNDLATARYAYLQALAKQPENPELHYRLAQIELKSGKPDSARWEAMQALASAPQNSGIWTLMGQIAAQQQNPEQAARYYQQAINPDGLLQAAKLLEAQHQPQSALNLYKAVETLAENDADQLYALGQTYAEHQQNERAEAVLKRFLTITKAVHDSRTEQAQALLKQVGRKHKR